MTAPTMPLRANDHHQANDIEETERAHLATVLGQVRAAVARSWALAARTEESHREAGAQLAASRLLYSMGRDKVIPSIFGKVHPKYQTPWVGALFIGAVALVLSLVLTMADLATLVNFGALASFIMLNFAVFWYFFIKEKKRYSFGNIVKYLICPWLGILILSYVFTGFDLLTYGVGVSWFVVGLIIAAVISKGFKEVPDAFKNLDV